MKDEHPAKPQCVSVPESPGNEEGEEDLLVDAHEVVLDVELHVEGRVRAVGRSPSG